MPFTRGRVSDALLRLDVHQLSALVAKLNPDTLSRKSRIHFKVPFEVRVIRAP